MSKIFFLHGMCLDTYRSRSGLDTYLRSLLQKLSIVEQAEKKLWTDFTTNYLSKHVGWGTSEGDVISNQLLHIFSRR